MSEKAIQPQDKYVLRLPDGMRDDLKSKALENGRSLNAEIVHRLSISLSAWLIAVPEDVQSVAKAHPPEVSKAFESAANGALRNLSKLYFPSPNRETLEFLKDIERYLFSASPEAKNEIAENINELVKKITNLQEGQGDEKALESYESIKALLESKS